MSDTPKEQAKRPVLLQLMGYSSKVGYPDDEAENLNPHWEAVLNHLIENPSEASYKEDDEFPLDHALWVEYDPVPVDVVIRLLRAHPQALTQHTYEIALENPNSRPEVIRLLRAADVEGKIAGKRTKLIQLMGYPPYTFQDDYEQEDVQPDWNAVRERLVTNPNEANITDDGAYPLADALWIESDPVPLDIVQTLINLCPKNLTDQAFEHASCNEELDDAVLSHLFVADKKNSEKDSNETESFVQVEMEE